MDVNKFNEESTKLINESNGKVGFVDETVMDRNAGVMRLCADNIITCVKESFDICVKQNITADDDLTFGIFLLDMAKNYYKYLARSDKKPTAEEAETATIAIMSNMTVEEMRKSLAYSTAEKDMKTFEEVFPTYLAHSDGIIQDAFKTLSINRILGVQ